MFPILEEMREILLEANELMDEWQRTDFPKTQKWAERWLLLNDSWAESRSSIFKAVLQSTFAVLEDVKCVRCMTENAIVKCHECSPAKHFFHECDNHIHGNSMIGMHLSMGIMCLYQRPQHKAPKENG